MAADMTAELSQHGNPDLAAMARKAAARVEGTKYNFGKPDDWLKPTEVGTGRPLTKRERQKRYAVAMVMILVNILGVSVAYKVLGGDSHPDTGGGHTVYASGGDGDLGISAAVTPTPARESIHPPTKEPTTEIVTATPPAPKVLPEVGGKGELNAVVSGTDKTTDIKPDSQRSVGSVNRLGVENYNPSSLQPVLQSVAKSREARGVWVGAISSTGQLQAVRETIVSTTDTRAEDVYKVTIASENPPSQNKMALLLQAGHELIFDSGIWKLVGNVVVCDDIDKGCRAEGLSSGMGENARARGQYQRNGPGKIWMSAEYLSIADKEMLYNTLGHEIWHAITPTPDNWWVLAYFKPDETEWLLIEYDKITNLYREEARGHKLYNPYWGGESSDESSREVVEQHFWVEKWLQYIGLEEPSYYYTVSPELQKKFDAFFERYSSMIKRR